MLTNFLHTPAVLADPLAQVVAAGEQRLTVDAAILAKAMDMLGDFAINLTVAAIIFALTLVAARWASGAARKLLGRTKAVRRDPTVLAFMVQIVRVVVIIIGMIAVLQRLGVQTTSIIAVLGAASLAVGLALQGTLSNVAAGVMLLVLRPYRVGEVIDVGGASGTVQKLDLFTTQLTNANNHKIVIPNSKVLSDVIINLTGQRTRRIEIKFTVGYGENLKEARDVLAAVAQQVVHFLLGLQPAGGGRFAQLHAPRAGGGFLALDDFGAGLAQHVGQTVGQRGLAGAVDAFDSNQQTAENGGVRHRATLTDRPRHRRPAAFSKSVATAGLNPPA